MKIDVYIEKKLGRKWFECSGVYFTGSLFLDNHFLTESEIFDCLNRIESINEFQALLKKANGFFSCIIKKANKIFAAVDRVRSIPLFFSTKDARLVVSNDAEYVRKATGNTVFDPIAVQEFTARMVCGHDTLFKDVKQVYTGECVEFSVCDGCVDVNEQRYFTFMHSEKFTKADSAMLEQKMIDIFSECIDRLIDYANGRQLVLPLSAGYDSRFIALMLYKKGVKNVVCFSYGKKGNFEAEISKQVAEVLGFKWEFIEYTDELRYKWYRVDDHKKYLRMASGWSSAPHTQDFFAVQELKKDKKIDTNAVFIPGHVGDSLAGSDVPYIATKGSRVSTKQFFYNLFIKYYNNLQTLPKTIAPKKIKNKWNVFAQRVSRNIDFSLISSVKECADAYERWNWQESNAKFIINSVRVYEFWGYDWYLPFVDKAFMEFWKMIPLELRCGKCMYNKVVDDFYFNLLHTSAPHPKNNKVYDSFFKKKLKEKMRYTWLHSVYLNMRVFLGLENMDRGSTNNSFASFDECFIKQYCCYLKDINFLFIVDFLLNAESIMNTDL